MSETSSGISRRTIVKGTAWAVPAVAVATALPAAAQSPCIIFTLGDQSCKTAGVPFYYSLQLCVVSTCAGTGILPLTVNRIDTGNGNYLTETEWSANGKTPGSPLTTALFDGSGCVFVDGYSHGSPVNLTINYTLANGTTGSYTVDAPPTQGGCTAG